MNLYNFKNVCVFKYERFALVFVTTIKPPFIFAICTLGQELGVSLTMQPVKQAATTSVLLSNHKAALGSDGATTKQAAVRFLLPTDLQPVSS